ncbi:MAG: Ferric uptake regulation protein [Alphaproteobacteria bacterium MarineAlpha4_Bin2]|nr:MAG: Ferric uptake regulation protein [Alphaproteobacteria bacterium MarineAlpha4_Bin2]
MQKVRPYSNVLTQLQKAGLRPTRQRLALAKLLFEGGDRHVTAEKLHNEAVEAGIKVSLATVYNALHQFTKADLLREVVVESGRAYFDTNNTTHHHIFHQATGDLYDIPDNAISSLALPEAPEGTEIDRIEIIVRVKSSAG